MRARPLLIASLLCTFALVWPGDGHAQEEKKAGKKDKTSEVGDYDGVQAGASKITPPGARGKGKRRAAAFWVGFEPQEGGSSRVFVQLGTSVDFEQWVEGKTLVVHMPRVRIGNRTVARFLDTRFFETSIRTIRTKSVGPRKKKGDRPAHAAGLQLLIDFKNPADLGQASASMNAEQDGYNYLYLDFGAGTDLPNAE
jgi:hypothetical protein